MKKELGIAVLVAVICIGLTVYSREMFLSPDNVQDMLKRISVNGIFSIGLGVVIITGGIDLSVGSVFALQGVLLGLTLNEKQWPFSLAVLASILLCIGLGAIHGFLVTKAKLQPFIVTLCGLLIYRSLARSIMDDHSQGLGEANYGWLESAVSGKIQLPQNFYIPSSFIILLVVAAIMWVVLHRSVYGRYLFAIGRNEEAARFSGINTKLVIASAYMLCLALAAISGIILVFDVRSIGPSNFGLSYELYGIAAAVLGGCSLKGGEGSVIGVILGTALLQVLLNLVQLVGIKSTWEGTVLGTVILLGVLIDQFIQSRRSTVKLMKA
ncbi:MAG TPA: ABC transporter permease [Phycisphaerae bacterium]|jgi:ribose transport system permease protein